MEAILRDFNSGDIHGDVTINDNSSNTDYKLLIHCSNEELLHEEQHRQDLLRKERSRKSWVTWRFIALSALLLLIAAGWFYIQGEMNSVTLLVGAAGVMTGMATLKQVEQQTPFEQRQIATLNEINTLLRERRAR
jgi:predicted anti-sigma-YlaC factor YlaD